MLPAYLVAYPPPFPHLTPVSQDYHIWGQGNVVVVFYTEYTLTFAKNKQQQNSRSGKKQGFATML